MSDVTRNVTIALNIRAGAVPDLSRYTAGVADYYGEFLRGGDVATRSLETVGQGVSGVSGKLDVATSGAAAFGVSFDQSLDTSLAGLKALIASGTGLDGLTTHLREVAGQIMSAQQGLSPEQQEAGVNAIMANLKEHQASVSRSVEEAGIRMGRSWAGVTSSMSQAVEAGSRMIGMVSMLTGRNADIEELARRFVHVESSIRAVEAGGSMFRNMTEGVNRVQMASKAASEQVALIGTGASMSTQLLARLGPAAAGVSAALGPIGLALAAISAAMVAYQAVSAVWGDSAEEDARKAAEGLQGYLDMLQKVTQEIQRSNQQLEFRVGLLQSEQAMNLELQGGKLDPQQFAATFEDEKNILGKQRRGTIREGFQEAWASIPQEKMQVLLQQKEIQKAEEAKEKYLLSLPTGSRERLELAGTAAKNIERRDWIEGQEERLGITDLGRLQKSGQTDLGQLAAAILVLPQGMQAAMREAIKTTAEREQSTFAANLGQSNRQISMLETEGQALERKEAGLKREFERGLKAAQDIQNMDFERKSVIESTFRAGNNLESIEAISPFISPDRQSELRMNANRLTAADFQAEFADASESESELQTLNQQLDEIRRERQAIIDVKNEMKEARESVVEVFGELRKEVQALNRAIR